MADHDNGDRRTSEVDAIEHRIIEGHEAWVRTSPEPHLRSVEAVKNDAGGGWSVKVAAMNPVGAEYAACADLRAEIEGAIKSVAGVNEVESELDGAWFRGFDFRRWEYWASNSDWEWGPWCTEVGWTQGWITSVFGSSMSAPGKTRRRAYADSS